MFEGKNVLAIQCSNTQIEQYAVFCDDKGLYHGNGKGGFALLSILDNIVFLNRPIKIYYHFPYICVTERYGLNAATVSIADRRVIKHSREDYYCNVSSYSIGFLERNGRVLLIHQTQWNRLDITDIETGQLLTEREVVFGKTDETETNRYGASSRIKGKNYLDYFHSLLHVSPDGKHFLSNGWMWQPTGNIMCFETERFFNEFELCGESIEYDRDYNWDRPCAFVGNDTLVIAADRDEIIFREDVAVSESKEPPAYHQLLFYKLSEIKTHIYTYDYYEGYDIGWLAYSMKADCDVFTFNEEGEITSGELHYDPETERLIALSEKGAFELTLDGEIKQCNPDINLSACNEDIQFNDVLAIEPSVWLQNWQYDIIRRSFYRFHNGSIEKKVLCSR